MLFQQINRIYLIGYTRFRDKSIAESLPRQYLSGFQFRDFKHKDEETEREDPCKNTNT